MQNIAKIDRVMRKNIIAAGFIIFFMGFPKIDIPLSIHFTTKHYLTPFPFPRKISPAIEQIFPHPNPSPIGRGARGEGYTEQTWNSVSLEK
jgi:hypothetical protein